MVYGSRCSYLKGCWIKSGFISLNYKMKWFMFQLEDHFKIPQLTQKQPLPWIKMNMLVSKSLVNIYLSLQLGGAEDENRASREGSHFCLILSHVAHVHHLHMCGPAPPSAVLQELHELRASGCTSRLHKENAPSEQSIQCSWRTQRVIFSFLCFPSFLVFFFPVIHFAVIITTIVFIILFLLQNAVLDDPCLSAQGNFVEVCLCSVMNTYSINPG